MSKVAVFGDAMLDIYHIGTADRLSAEVPIPVVKITQHRTFRGGAGNVIANLEALGVEVVDCTSDRNSGPQQGPHKNRLMVGDHQIARWDTEDHCQQWSGEFPQGIDAVVIADYNKGGVPRNVQWPRDLPMFVDTKLPPRMYPAWAWFFPNSAEYSKYEEEYDGLDQVVLKEGAHGVRMISQGSTIHSVPAEAKIVRSVNGAGDTVMAAFVESFLAGDDPFTCLVNANFAAAIAVEKPFTATVTKEELRRRSHEY